MASSFQAKTDGSTLHQNEMRSSSGWYGIETAALFCGREADHLGQLGGARTGFLVELKLAPLTGGLRIRRLYFRRGEQVPISKDGVGAWNDHQHEHRRCQNSETDTYGQGNQNLSLLASLKQQWKQTGNRGGRRQ